MSIEKLVISMATEVLVGQCYDNGYVNKALITEAMIDQTIIDVACYLFKGNKMDVSLIKAELMRRHIQENSNAR